ncbi:helix-turn-helix transcriptional regulator [Myceligenerans halotolerans]
MAKPPKSEAAKEFGARVRQRRQALGKSLEQLDEMGGGHWSFLGQVERGQRNPTLHNILKIAEALGVDPAELITGLRPPVGSDGSK